MVDPIYSAAAVLAVFVAGAAFGAFTMARAALKAFRSR